MTSRKERSKTTSQKKTKQRKGGSRSAVLQSKNALRTIYLSPSSRSDKKYMVRLGTGSRWIHFGQKGASDFTLHHDLSRKQNYLRRHHEKENWSRTGLTTAGFWSRWFLWNKASKREAARDIEQKFNVRVVHWKER